MGNTGQGFPPVPSTLDQRPHTISSAYERAVHSRPSLAADTFTPLPTATSGCPTSRSRPPSIHGTLPSAGPPSSASPYAVPCIVPKHRRDTSAGGAKVADIYARPALVGARSGSVRALPVARRQFQTLLVHYLPKQLHRLHSNVRDMNSFMQCTMAVVN